MVELVKPNYLNVNFFLLLFFLSFGFSGFGQSDSLITIIDSSKNIIQNIQNDSNWTAFVRKVHRFKSEKKGKISIVHLGDSHIQGGHFTNHLRAMLNRKYGVIDRGLVFPYSLVNTSGPSDVKFYSSSKWVGRKYNLNVREEKTSIAGYNLWMNDTNAELSIALKQGSDTLFPFNEVILYHNSPSLQVYSSPNSLKMLNSGEDNFYSTRLIFNALLDSVQLHVAIDDSATRKLAFYGIELVSNKPGIVYHSTGSNGTTFEAFSKAIDYLPMLRVLCPDLIIISLGTNDAYVTHVDTLQLKKRIRSMINNIKKELPESCIMLTTPGDHLRDKKYPNPNLIKIHSAIVTSAIEGSCVFWDFFEIMGGLYSSKQWDKNGLMFKDIIHLSKEGYKLQGELFFEALDRAIKY